MALSTLHYICAHSGYIFICSLNKVTLCLSLEHCIRGDVTPLMGHQSNAGHHEHTHSHKFSHLGMGGGRKLEEPEETRMDTERTWTDSSAWS